MHRRQFVSTAAAAVLGLPAALAARPTKYDLIVKGGRVIDPSRKLNAIRDVAIADGRIAAVKPNITADAADVLDARGKLVVPGLIDIHTHATRTADGPGLCLADGVTGLIDAGSQGADHIGDAIMVARSAPQACRVLINIGRAGILPEGDTMDLSRADVGAARAAIERNRDMIAGIKARLSREVAGNNDVEVLKRAQEVAAPFRLPVMIHMGQTVSPLPALLAILKSGDIVTHMFAPPPNGIIDDNGKILPEVREARQRGVIFDLGNGRVGHLALGCRRTRASGRIPAGYFLHRLDTGKPNRASDRLPERHVEVSDAGYVDGPSHRVRDHQSIPQLSGLPQCWNAESGRPRRHRGARAKSRGSRVRRQLREQTDWPAKTLSERHHTGRQTRGRPRVTLLAGF